MLHLLLFLNLLFTYSEAEPKKDSDVDADRDLGGDLVSQLRNDQNLDLSEDEEYEDLRAEFLAYHTALASLTASMDGRRSLLSTPCWQLGGICIDFKLCTGFRFLTEVPGCKDKFKVCCFVWNQFNVRDYRHEGIYPIAMPWSHQEDFGGKGVLKLDSDGEKKQPKSKLPILRSSSKDANKRKKIFIIKLNK